MKTSFLKMALFIHLSLLFTLNLNGQVDTIQKRQRNIKALPIVYYLPETSLGFGAAGITTFEIDNKGGNKPSQLLFSLSYTLKNQILISFPFEIYTKKDKNRFMGEVGFFKYYYNFYGLTMNSKKEDLEYYYITYPRGNFSYTRKINSKVYMGALYKFDVFNIDEIESDGYLNSNNVFGKEGGMVSSIGAEFLYDSRDNIINSRKGIFLNIRTFFDNELWGSDFSFNKSEIDIRYFASINKKHSLAFNLINGFITGNNPFFQDFFLSNSYRLRGFADRRFQGGIMGLFQTEYRFPIYKKLSGVAFSGFGKTTEGYANLFEGIWKNSTGIGLRYLVNEKEGVNLRVDYGRTNEGGNFYITVKEAF